MCSLNSHVLCYTFHSSERMNKINMFVSVVIFIVGTFNGYHCAIFTRWGRRDCPAKDELVYTGAAGGTGYGYKAGPANTLCLPLDPEYSLFKSGLQNTGSIFGSEYQIDNQLPSYNHIQDHNIPCAVCRIPEKQEVIMVPAKRTCPKGWRQEYKGYLMGGHFNHAASEFICMDISPQVMLGGHRNEDGHLFYFVEGVCGSLPCPPYKQHRELTCVVCSR